MPPESPFRNRLGTNYALSPQEILEIRRLLEQPRKQVRALEAEIARLEEQRDKLKTFIDDHHSLLSPIRRIDTDVLREIFARCLPEEHLPCRNLREAPLLLTGICHSWREVAIGTPDVPIPQSFHALMEMRAQGLEVWLRRSGMMPLTLSLHASTLEYMGLEHYDIMSLEDLEEVYMGFIQRIFPYSYRWRSVSFSVPKCLHNFIGTHKFERLDALTTVRIAFQSRPDLPIARTRCPLVNVFSLSHSLHALHLDGAYLDLPIHWENLTEVTLSQSVGGEAVSPSKLLRLLTLSCTSLRRCAACITPNLRAITPDIDRPFKIVLPHLHTLDLDFNTPLCISHSSTVELISSQLAMIFDAIVAPVLTHLRVEFIGPQTMFHWSGRSPRTYETLPIVSFVQRSGCTIQRFKPHFPMAIDGLVDLLVAMPSLSEFAMNPICLDSTAKETPFVSFVHERLTPELNPLLPHLETVYFTACSALHVESILAFAEGRCGREIETPRKLRKLTTSFKTFLEDMEVSAQLQKLRDRGLSVHWSSPKDTRGNLYDDDPLRGMVGRREMHKGLEDSHIY